MIRVLLALAVAVVGTLVLASTASALDKPEVLRFVDVEERSSVIGGPPPREDEIPVAGQVISFRDGLYAWDGAKRGKRVGRADGVCTVTRVSIARQSATLYCAVEAKVPGGRILLAGFITFGETSDLGLSVIGGTGRFDNAKGTFTLRELPSGNAAVVFRLKP